VYRQAMLSFRRGEVAGKETEIVCGIAGMFKTASGSVADASAIRRMCQTLLHRGPDDEGVYVKDAVGLGMRRLSIIDLSGGRQPIHNEDQTVWVVFNGEIYNFPALRAELERAGHRFYTNTDTEVIVHLYEDLGSGCVEKLRGMFAIALYDERRRSLLLARDRLGKKPLYYSVGAEQLLFGSEIKALLAVAPELAEVNPEAILQYFYFGYILDPATAFRFIRKLPPGFLLEFANGQIRLRRYWDVPTYGTAEPKSDEECLDELERRLDEAVRVRLMSDVPLGALLSGGVDSSVIVALMARASAKPIKTFTIGFSHKDFNEAEAARAVSERFGTEHRELVVEPQIVDTLHQLTGSLEEPFADSSILPTYYVSQLTRQHVTVALTGDGGDELFAGYERYEISLKRQVFDHFPGWAGRWYRECAYPRLPSSFFGRRLLFNVSLSACDRYLDGLSHLPACHRERTFFSKEFLNSLSRLAPPLRAFQDHFEKAPADSLLSRLLYLDTKTYLPGDVLTKVDRMSMAASLELRAPLLDHHVVEWIAALPERFKLRNGHRKYLLKKLAARVGVPHDILHRPKHGFALPLVHWMRGRLHDDLLEILVEPRTLQRGYFNPDAVRTLLAEHSRGRRDHSAQIWLLLMFELWHRNFLASVTGRELQWSSSESVASVQVEPMRQRAPVSVLDRPSGSVAHV
jgi:asparagine synthase (glutamine-hydrolysing)